MSEPSARAGLRLLVRMAWRTDRFALLVGVTAALVSAVLSAVFPWFYGGLVDAAIDGTTGTIVAFAVALGLAQAAAMGLRSMSGMLSWNLFERMTVTLDQDLVGLATRLEVVEHLEDPEFQDRLTLVRTNREHFQESMSTLLWTVVMGLQLVVTVALLASVAPLLLVLPLVAVAPILTSRWSEARTQRALREAIPDTRASDGHALLAIEPRLAGEVRVLRLADLATTRQRDAWARAVDKQWRAELVGTLASTGGLVLFTAGFAAALLYVTDRSLSGDATLGEVVLVLTAGQGLHAQLGSLLAHAGALFRIVETMRNLLGLQRYVDAHELPGTDRPPSVLSQGIELREVSFRYTGADHDALDGVSLVLPAGAVVAVVGDNGAGKSTLVALLCGLHEPTAGQVDVDGQPLASIDATAWRNGLTAAFQEFVRYELHAREAIGLGAVDRVEDDDAIRAALAGAGVSELEAELPQGLDTPLGTAFLDGVDISGGQWQKIALARSMMRPLPLLRVLDEPTYSLDVESERRTYEWFSGLANQDRSAGTITVIVSHRFSTVRTADLVVVMADGRIMETGTHDELLGSGGSYADMYRTQAAGYR
jgi:ATP-binding cassette subfamily B protein